MKALETSARSLDEILSFINTTIEDAKGCEDWGGLTLWIYFRGFFQEVHSLLSRNRKKFYFPKTKFN